MVPSNRTEILINLCPEFSVLAGGQVRYGWQQSALLLDFAQQQHNAQPLGQITGVMKLIWGLPGDEDKPTCKAPGCKNGWQRPPMLHNASWPAPEPPEIASFSPGIWLFNLTEVCGHFKHRCIILVLPALLRESLYKLSSVSCVPGRRGEA